MQLNILNCYTDYSVCHTQNFMILYADSLSRTDWFSRHQSHLVIHPVTFTGCFDSPCHTLAGCPSSRCCTLDCYPDSHRHTWLGTRFPQSDYHDSCRHTLDGCANSHLKAILIPSLTFADSCHHTVT